MELLKNLTEINSPSGNEEKIREYIISKISDCADEYFVDALGNLIVHKNGNGDKLLISAHIDEVGFLTMTVDKDGFIHPSKIGNVNVFSLQSQRVIFNDDTPGIINLSSSKSLEKANIKDYYIDAFDECKAKDFAPYDYATFAPNYYEAEKFVCSKALSSRSGCFVLMNLIKTIENSPLDLYFVFAVQGEMNFHCVKTAINSIKPDYAINVECILCDDIPGGKKEIKFNNGPVIKIMDKTIITHRKIKNALINAANSSDIKIQYEISDNTESDAGSISTSLTGIITGALAIPCRNLHSPNEIISRDDLNNTIYILRKICEEGL